MNSFAVQTSKSIRSPVLGVIDWISLNVNEVKCLEMALYFLTEQLNKTKQNLQFLNFRDYQLRYMSDWIYDSRLKSQLRTDGLNTVVWPVMDIEDIKWFALALEFGITEEIVVSMASDDAHYDRDMAEMYGDDIDLNSHYYAFHRYYCSIARLKLQLLPKLKNILSNYYAI